MPSFRKVSLGIIFILALLVSALADDGDDDKKKEAEEDEKDPWDKSTDKYRHNLGDNRAAGGHEEEPVKIDVTEVSESEVHSGRSKVCKNGVCKYKVAARKAPLVAKATKPKRKPEAQYFNKNDVDDETKEQIIDATDEKDPADARYKESKTVTKSHHKHQKKQHRASKKQLNPKVDYYPGNLWEYPYPYHHNLKYGCGGNDQNCDEAIEAKEEAKEQGSLEKLLFSSDAKATPIPQEAKIESAVPPEESTVMAVKKPTEALPEPVPKIEAKPEEKKKHKKESVIGSKIKGLVKGFASRSKGHQISEIGTSWETPCFYNADTKKFSCGKQLIPSHYYGPPSAGWGGFQPGHTGAGWGVPHWNRKCSVPHKPHKHCRQLIPSHYYGPPSAGWGGFQPGHTGAGWGVPHWNKRCHTPRVNCRSKTLYRQPGKNSWFVYNPHESASWQADPSSWYRFKGIDNHDDTQGSMRYKVSRPEDTINRITPLVVHPRSNIAALHEWITFLETEREKDRQLERYKLQMRDKENQRRYNLEVLRYKQAQDSQSSLAQLDGGHSLAQTGSSQIRYYSKPQEQEEQEFEKKAVDYVLSQDGMGTTLFNDKK